MTIDEMMARATTLEETIRVATPTKRLEMQPEFARMLTGLRRNGQVVPVRMRSLEQLLVDEVIESRFDNMPV